MSDLEVKLATAAARVITAIRTKIIPGLSEIGKHVPASSDAYLLLSELSETARIETDHLRAVLKARTPRARREPQLPCWTRNK